VLLDIPHLRGVPWLEQRIIGGTGSPLNPLAIF
jgi:hypothetical protein